MAVVTELTLGIEQFLTFEADLLDRQRYREWLALWAEDGHYWIPANGEGTDPDKEVSVIYDDRASLEIRVNRFESGLMPSRIPEPRTRHVVSNLRVSADPEESGELFATVNMIVGESQQGSVRYWMGFTEYGLLPGPTSDRYQIRSKKVVLINNDQPLAAMPFLL
jgi:3-phenylpropionate/cinnamic acid dioxygenase small subunit